MFFVCSVTWWKVPPRSSSPVAADAGAGALARGGAPALAATALAAAVSALNCAAASAAGSFGVSAAAAACICSATALIFAANAASGSFVQPPGASEKSARPRERAALGAPARADGAKADAQCHSAAIAAIFMSARNEHARGAGQLFAGHVSLGLEDFLRGRLGPT